MRRITHPEQHRFFGPRSFYREAVLVMLPVMLQQMANSLFNFIDNLMVGLVDAPTLAGVSVANRVFLIFNGLFWGLTGTGAALIAQFYGADDREECDRIFLLQILAGLFIGAVFTGLLTFFPREILTFFIKDPVTIGHGLAYTDLIRFSYLPAAFTMVCLFSLRAIGHNHMPLITGSVAMLINVFLNWVLIFGNLGAPAMGARGAALATLIARLLEASSYLVWIGAGKTLFSWQFRLLGQLKARVALMALRKVVPLTANEFLYTSGLSVMFWSYSQINESAIPALVISEQATQLLLVVFGGMGTGVSILVGTRLGAGQFDQARLNARLLLVFLGLVAIGVTIIALVLSPFVPRLFAVPDAMRHLATQLIMIQAIFVTPWIMHAVIFFSLRAGGAMRSALMVDAVYMWLMPIPAAIGMALWRPPFLVQNLVVVFLIVQFLFQLHLLPAWLVFRRGTWVKNLTAG